MITPPIVWLNSLLGSFDLISFAQNTVTGQVIFSKIGALIIFSVSYKIYTVYTAHENLLAVAIRTKSTLPEPLQEELKTYFKEQHNLTVKFSDSEGCVAGLQSLRYGSNRFIFIPAQDRTVLCEGSTYGLSKNHIVAMLDHEANHLKHPDIFLRNVCATLIEPTALLAGKLASVYGTSTKVAIGIGILVYYVGVILKQKLVSQQQEKRADYAAGTTPEKCREIAKYLEIRYLPHDRVATSQQIFIHRLFGDHPLNTTRIAYLEEQAQKLEQQK